MKKNAILILLLSFFTFSSCKKDQKTEKVKTADTIRKEDIEKETSNKTATLFTLSNQDSTEVVKISASEISSDNPFFLVGEKNVLTVSRYAKNGKSLQFVQKETLLSDEFYYVNIDEHHFLRKKIQNEDYFLFAVMESSQGNGDREIILNFIMLNVTNLKSYTLKYVGEATLRSDEGIDGAFLKNENLEANATIKKELYQFANKSKWVYNPTEEEKDINYYKNFEQKWQLDNNANTESSFPNSVKSTYYSENLFQFNGNYDKDQVIENDRFKIVTYFRHNIIGYDKTKKLYFPIIAESCATGCDKKIEFVSENEIEITYEITTQKSDTLDLNTIRFTNND